MSDWKEYKFSDFVEINPSVKIPKGIPVSFVEMKDLDCSVRYCESSQLKELTGGSRFMNGDTLFARITPCLENGKICQVRNLKNGYGFGSTEFHVFRGKEGVSDNDFVYYFSRWDEVRDFAEHNLEGSSGRQRVSKEAFDNLFLILPPLPTQRRIAAILSSLDDKIDLLRRENATLEAMAETLFRQWFVVEAKEGWEEGKLGDWVVIKRGGSPRPINDYIAPSGYRWLKISDVTNLNSPYIFQTKEYIKESGLQKTVYLRKGSLVLSNSATPGIAKILCVDSCIHDGWLYFPKSSFSKIYLYLLFKYIREDLVNLGNGSIFTNLKTDILKDYKVVKPDAKTLENFDHHVHPIFDKLYSNDIQIQTLIQTRDGLLPKLMSNEITI